MGVAVAIDSSPEEAASPGPLAAAATSVYQAGKSLVEGTWSFVQQTATGTFYGVADFFTGLLRLDLSGMVGAVGRVLDNLAFRAPMRLVTALLDAAEHGMKAAVHLLPFSFLQGPMAVSVERIFGAGRTIVTAVLDMGSGILRTLWQSIETLAEGIDKIVRGRPLEGLRDMVQALLEVVPRTASELMRVLRGSAKPDRETDPGHDGRP